MAADKGKIYVTKAPPPIEAVGLMVMVGCLALLAFPSMQTIDELAKPEIFTKRLFPGYVSLGSLIYIRLMFALLCLAVTTDSVLGKGTTYDPPYLPASKLRRNPFQLKGIKLLFPFTCWCWNLLGTSFAFSAYTAWRLGNGETVSPLILRISLMLWETAAPFTLLVAAVTKYALWPMRLKEGPDHVFKTAKALLQHNVNVVMAVCEVGLLGGLPVKMGHISLSVLFGVAYVFFTWSIMYQWTPGKGPVFIYFFMDTTLGRTTTIALIALLGVLMFFYGIFSGAEWLLETYGPGLGGHIGFVVVMCLLVCRVRD